MFVSVQRMGAHSETPSRELQAALTVNRREKVRRDSAFGAKSASTYHIDHVYGSSEPSSQDGSTRARVV
jgi:hypothetical protein